jgi:tripartite-type tricarboxylate transporter receptor subunit TctC
MKKFIFIILMFTSQIALAQINLVVPYAAGGAYDHMSRKFAKFVETKMNEQVTIENVGGAGGLIGLKRLLTTPNSIAITNNNIDFLAEEKKLVLSDYQQITLMAENPYFLAVAATSGLTCESLRNRNNKYFIGSAGTGSGSSFPAVIVIEKYPNFTEVPYKGMSQALNDLLGKSIHIGFVSGETQQRTDLVMLANTTSQTFRGIPSWSKCLGIDKKYTGQFLMITRASSDAVFVSKMKKLVDEFVKDPETVEYFKLNGFSRH